MSGQADLVLRFEVAGRPFGVRLGEVHELLPMAALTPVPGAPGLEGLLNLRGTVVPVLDLRAALRLPAREPEPADRLIVARVGGRLLALRAEHLHDLVPLVGPAAPAGELGLQGALQVARLAEGLVFLPDLAALARVVPDGGGRHDRQP